MGHRMVYFLLLRIKGHRCLLNVIDEITGFGSFIFSMLAYIIKYLSVIMLPVYIYYKDDTFLYKTGLFHAHTSHSLRVSIPIVKYVKNGHIIFGSAINAERAAWSSQKDIPFAGVDGSHHTRVCPVAIGRMVAEISARDCIRVRQFLQFLRILVWAFHVLRQWGKGLSCSSCNAAVMHLSDPASPHCTPIVYHLRRVKISALYSQTYA